MSSSRSATSSEVWQMDNRRVIGQDGVSAEGGSSVTINRTSLDGEVANRAFQSIAQGYEFGGGVVAEALGFGGQALGAALDAQSDALAFADSNAARASAQSYNFATDALGGALGFGTLALNKAYGTVSETSNLVKDAYADAKGRGALTDKILMGSIAAMAVVALMAVKK